MERRLEDGINPVEFSRGPGQRERRRGTDKGTSRKSHGCDDSELRTPVSLVHPNSLRPRPPAGPGLVQRRLHRLNPFGLLRGQILTLAEIVGHIVELRPRCGA